MGQSIFFGTVSVFLIIATFVEFVTITSPAKQEHKKIDRIRRGYESHRGKHHGNNLAGGNEIFTTENSTVVIAQVGGTAILPCGVRKFNNGVVSWIRRRDYHLLTVGLTTYSSDERFLVEHARHLQNWGLQIKFVTPNDAGVYECQVSTHPPMSIFVRLKVIEAAAEIVGAPDLYIKSGSTLRIVCSMRQNTEIPVYVFWYHDDRMINYGVERVSVSNEKSVSILQIEDAEKTDSGNYSCVPSNAKPANVNVHVLNGGLAASFLEDEETNEMSPQLDIFFPENGDVENLIVPFPTDRPSTSSARPPRPFPTTPSTTTTTRRPRPRPTTTRRPSTTTTTTTRRPRPFPTTTRRPNPGLERIQIYKNAVRSMGPLAGRLVNVVLNRGRSQKTMQGNDILYNMNYLRGNRRILENENEY